MRQVAHLWEHGKEVLFFFLMKKSSFDPQRCWPCPAYCCQRCEANGSTFHFLVTPMFLLLLKFWLKMLSSCTPPFSSQQMIACKQEFKLSLASFFQQSHRVIIFFFQLLGGWVLPSGLSYWQWEFMSIFQTIQFSLAWLLTYYFLSLQHLIVILDAFLLCQLQDYKSQSFQLIFFFSALDKHKQRNLLRTYLAGSCFLTLTYNRRVAESLAFIAAQKKFVGIKLNHKTGLGK